MGSRKIGRRPQLVLLLALLLAGPAVAGSDEGAAAMARSYVDQHLQALGLAGADVAEMAVSSTVASRDNGVTHVYFQQRYRGIAVDRAILGVHVGADGTVVGVNHRFVAGIAAAAGDQQASKSALEAAHAAADQMGFGESCDFEVLGHRGGADQAMTLSDGGIAEQPIDAKLVWVPVDGGVRLAWSLEIAEVGGQHWWTAHVDAETGAVLGWDDRVIHDSAQGTAEALARPSGKALRLKAFPLTDGAQYTVFPLPFESPNDGGRLTVSGAADPSASPFGWHDTDGVPGPEFTRTRGNNVHAYTDVDANGVPDTDSDPDGGPGLFFDFPLDLGQDPSTYAPAAVTNLFYWNNVIHDVTHGYGFDEAAGNFQVNNYGNGGLGGDDVRAEAQDGGGTNNANFGTPSDGFRPRMQMFLWTPPVPNFVSVHTPAAIVGDHAATGAVFGPDLKDTGPVTADVSLADDGAGDSPTDACEPLVGFPSGDIALVDRGSCAFVLKVANAQAAGAVGVIVANNVPGRPVTMGGNDPTITIPSVMVSLDDGNLFKDNQPLNATLRSNPLATANRDGDLDAGVITHEYTHGISNRLTGGPAAANCLRNAEQMGEGWSDWFALSLTASAADTPLTSRGIGSYVIFEGADGDGIRPTPYSTDLGVNPSTYASVADVANISRPHGIGYVWSTMLWEVYWNLVDAHGFNPDIYGDWTTGGNNLAVQLVMDGMKLQPCSPGFVDGRDAILTADQALTGGANRCEIWRAFAKRGLGASADQGLSTDRTDGVAAFDLPASCTAAVFGGFQPPVDGPPDVNAVNAGSTVPVKFSLSGAGSLSIDSQPVDCVTLIPTGEAPIAPASPGGTGLTQHGSKVHLNWKTDPAWAGSCRRLTLRIPAASDAVAYFSFF